MSARVADRAGDHHRRGGRGRRRAVSGRRFLDRLAARAGGAERRRDGRPRRRPPRGDGRGAPARRPPSEMRAMARRAAARARRRARSACRPGLEYEPGSHASAAGDRRARRARPRAAAFYATHVRNEGDSALDALAEAVDVGRAHRGSAVHVSHLKLASAATRGRAADALAASCAPSRRDVTADWYPYSFWVSTTAALAPPRRAADARALGGACSRTWAGRTALTVTSFAADRSYEGKTVARDRGGAAAWSPADVLLDLERRGHAGIAGAGDGRGRPRGVPAQPAGDDRVRRRHPRRPSARARGRSRACSGRYVRERRVDPAGNGHPQDDGDAGAPAGAAGPRPRRAGRVRRPGGLRSRDRRRPRDGAGAPASRPSASPTSS